MQLKTYKIETNNIPQKIENFGFLSDFGTDSTWEDTVFWEYFRHSTLYPLAELGLECSPYFLWS